LKRADGEAPPSGVVPQAQSDLLLLFLTREKLMLSRCDDQDSKLVGYLKPTIRSYELDRKRPRAKRRHRCARRRISWPVHHRAPGRVLLGYGPAAGMRLAKPCGASAGLCLRKLLLGFVQSCAGLMRAAAARMAEHSFQRLAPFVAIPASGELRASSGMGIRLLRDSRAAGIG